MIPQVIGMRTRHIALQVPLQLLGTLALLGFFAYRAEAQQAGNTLVPDPAWDCGMPEGIPSPEDGNLIFAIDIPLDRVAEIGTTPFGERRVAVGLEGTVKGPKLSATVTPGALDFELRLANGAIEIEQILVLQAPDGSYIYVRNAGAGADSKDVRVVLDFEAPNASDYAWLNAGEYVARRALNASAKSLALRVYDVSGVTAATANAIRITKPAGVPAQPWDARKKQPGEMEAEMLIRENVTLAPGQSVGASKRGNRNIIPITGGELSGRITGKVLMGGADYQNLSPPAIIDARYLWQADDGEIIIVRNAGPFGALVPTFEARADGPYAYLNTGRYLSSNPGAGQGGVGITMYESTN
jgi:Protein of unknown function (DUF3237)